MPASTYDREMPLNAWVETFREIYFPTQNYGRSKQEIFTHLVRVIGGGARYLFREDDPASAREYLAKVFAWYCALANRLGLDVDGVMWSKFPGVCPHCLKETCQCANLSGPVDQKRLQVLAIENQHRRPRSLREWQTLLATIYRGPLGGQSATPSRATAATDFARLTEELGEVAEAIDLDDRVDLDAQHVAENEMADLLAWILGLANRVHLGRASFSAVSMADVVWERYPEKCAACDARPCNCVRGDYRKELASRGAMAPTHWDPRTGLANYLGLELYLKRAQAAFDAAGGTKVWGGIFFDLDRFGAVNKQHGHLAGDQVLSASAEMARQVIGEAGFLFRRGGEEFVAILPGAAPEQTREYAEAIRQRLEAHTHLIGDPENPVSLCVTASLGVASTPVDSRNPVEMLKKADERVLLAKERGRNRVVSADAEPKPAA